jgi:hypothetical protein
VGRPRSLTGGSATPDPDPECDDGTVLAVTWLGSLGWLGMLFLAIALVVVAVVLILYLWHVSGSGGADL